MTFVLIPPVALLYGVGAYLIIARNLLHIVIGLGLIAHGANLLLLLAGGAPGSPPLVGAEAARIADPLPQAMALTAIVITFGITAFLLAMAYRSWILHGDDVVEDDIDDRRIARQAPSKDDS